MPPMAPRRRSAVVSSSSAASRKAVNQPSQPSKFGIQHFFERHSQSQSQSQAAAAPVAAPLDPPNINPKPNLNHEPTVDPPPPPTASAGAATNAEEQVSPEIAKSAPPKRFKFSPGMLIKQSQDDGGEEVTWRISPVNERLRSLAAKAKGLPMMTSFFSNDSSKPNAPTFQPCSTKQNSSSSKGELEKWLWSPTTAVPEKSLASSKRVSAEENNGCVGNGNKMDLQSPFLTPPSVSYGPLELIGGVACNGASDQLTSCQHRKALLELLDQVEDAITEEPVINGHGVNCGDVHMQPSVDGKGSHDASREQTFLVLEVSEKHRSADSLCTRYPIKVLRLLNEHSGQERTVHLCDEWFHSIIGPGDTANIIGVFDDEGKCVIDRHSNFLVIHPGILVSGTRVASSFTCPRRSILDERLKCSEHSISALVGTMLHQIFQVGLIKDLPTRDFLEEYAGMVLQKNMESIYACGAHEKDIYATLVEAIPKILNWLKCFRGPEEPKDVTIDFGHIDGEKTVSITEVMDIEEMAWAPRYGLKGMIDASVRLKMSSVGGGSSEIIMPLEFKTGKGSNSQPALEHCAQVILYTLLMSERYLEKNIDSGLLYYLQTNQTRGIKVQRSDLVGLIMRRNEFAADLLNASTTQLLPPMLQNSAMCKGCRHLSTCTVYHKAHGGNTKSSGLGDVFDRHVGHLTTAHCDFLKHWDRLIDLESKASQVTKKEILCPNSLVGEHNKNSLSSIILDVKNGFLIANESDNGRFIYHFVCKKLPYDDHEISSGEKTVSLERGASHLDCTLRCGDHVILSTESGHVAVANGVISEITHTHVSISFLRRLRLPGSCSSETGNLIRQVWRIDKDETSSIYAVMRFNLVQLFVQNSWSSHLRKMIVDLEVPRFDSGGMFSQDPALSYVQSEKSLNDDQRRAIHKILSAKDYSLILGMPGTGKTSTMVHAVKALLMRGSSILLTSYTNSAVDNLLIKLKDQAIDFIRIGRHEAVHDDVRGHCFSTMEKRGVEDIKQRMEHVRVVGVTCLGVNHPLLANKTFDICIMDEAGQTTLPVSLGPLMLASTFVLVGDHYQLPPLVQSTEARENGMDISLFRRLSEAHPQAIAALHCQYRMCAGIMELSNALIYGNRLRCGSSKIANAKLRLCNVEPTTLWMDEVLDTNKSVIFVNTDLLPAPEVKEHHSVNNPTEAYIISKITGEMLKRGIPEDDIGVITPYNSQATLIRRAVVAPIEIHTIDKYQGRDKECILVSFVRSSENSRACTSSLLGDWHRINVAITRAKKKLIMIGSCKTLSKVPLLKLLIEKVDEQCGILYVSNKDIHHTKILKKCSHMSVQ